MPVFGGPAAPEKNLNNQRSSADLKLSRLNEEAGHM